MIRDRFRLFEIFFLILIAVTAIYFRFVKLDWGEGYFFHPDERNIAGAVAQLRFPNELNPHFFAYGSVPVYIYFAVSALFKSSYLPADMFERSIMVGRIISAMLSVLSLVVVYKLGRNIGRRVGILAVVMAVFSVGLIQYAHFSTVESMLGFFYLIVVWQLIEFIKHGRCKYLVVASIFCGISIATKLTSLLIVPVVLISVFLGSNRSILSYLRNVGLALFLVVSIYVLLFPYSILDFDGFKKSLDYEGGVATGKIRVFYTRQYESSTPVVWHFTRVFPWTTGVLVTALLPIAWAACTGRVLRFKSVTGRKVIFLIWTWISIFFFWHAGLYVKWIRYIVPILPFVFVLLAWFIEDLSRYGRLGRVVSRIILIFVLFEMMTKAIIFTRMYRQTDTRVQAGKWAEKNISPGERILSEIYDLGVIAMPQRTMPFTKLFNFYDLDTDNLNERVDDLARDLSDSEWVMVPSRRIYGSLADKPQTHPVASKYYKLLFSGELGFVKVSEFSVDTFADEKAEETYQVFDHPKYMFFRKIKLLSKDKYIAKLTIGG